MSVRALEPPRTTLSPESGADLMKACAQAAERGGHVLLMWSEAPPGEAAYAIEHVYYRAERVTLEGAAFGADVYRIAHKMLMGEPIDD